MDVASTASSSQDMLLSRHYGQNIVLGGDYRSAKRAKSYKHGLIFSATPIPNDHLFQFTVEADLSEWSGSVKVGVTNLTPDQACSAETAFELSEHSYVLGTTNGASHLYIGGQEALSLPESVDLASLNVGSNIGVLCKSRNSLHFFIDQTRIAIELPPSHKLPKRRYAVIDVYGQCSEVRLCPLWHITERELSTPTHTLKLESQHLRLPSHGGPSKRKATNKKGCLLSSNDVCSSEVLHVHSQQILPLNNIEQVVHKEAHGDICSMRNPSDPVTNEMEIPSVERYRLTQPLDCSCDYEQLCKRFMKSLHLLHEESYFDEQYNKCYCSHCSKLRGDPNPPCKHHGVPKQKYALPVGWFKFGLKLSSAPQAQAHGSFLKWHKAYHGTTETNIQPILDVGGLLQPGTHTLGNTCVTRPEGHFSPKWRPEGFDPHQVFMSPSIRYSSQEAYSKSCRYTDSTTTRTYHVKVCFKLLVEPGSYDISRQTLRRDSATIDNLFSNEELEWSTKKDRVIYLYGLLVKMEPYNHVPS